MMSAPSHAGARIPARCFAAIRGPIALALAVWVVVEAGSAVVGARQDDAARTLDEQIVRIFQDGEYRVPRFGPAHWLPDGLSYTTIERSRDRPGASDIVRHAVETGETHVLVSGTQLVPEGSGSALEVDDYAWSSDRQRVLIFTNTRRVWRRNTRGDYWVLDLPSGRLHQLGAGAPPSTLMFAKFSPDGSRVAYVREHNIFVEHLDDGRVVPLTTDGSDTVINGTADWVNEEELNLRDGFRWSPDGRVVAYWQFDTAGVGRFALINNTDALYPTVTRIPYPKAGTTNSAVRIGVVGADGGATRWIQAPGDPREHYLAYLEWLDPATVMVQQLNRLQNRNDVLVADVRVGEVRQVFRDESDTWVDVVDEIPWVDQGRAFLWLSERDGWRHVFRVTREGGNMTLLTRFDADVIRLVGVDEARGWLYVLASPVRATERFLYRSRLDGTGVPERITPNVPGAHEYDMAPGGRFAVHTHSRFDEPPVTDLVELPSHRRMRSLTDTTALRAKLTAVVTPPAEFFSLDIGAGVVLDGWMLKPSHFDPARRYPVIAYVYGEPFTQTVVDRWGGSGTLFHRALAEAGYVIVSIDNRGTPAPRGVAWRKVVYGSIGDLSSSEQAAAVRALGARYPFIDLSRVGIWGWSGGGTSTLNALFRFPDVYQVGVAVAPVPDQRLYDTIYQERYMGLPQDNADGYRRGSPISFADGLEGKLLLVHGSGDDNVHLQGTEALVNRLVELGKSFDLMVYPNRTHAIAEGPGTTVHVYRLIAHYFLDHLPAGGRP